MGMKTLFTIHNLGYQGLFPPTVLPQVGLDRRVFSMDGLEFFGRVSFIKGGLNYSDALSTVSKKYALEIQTPEYGFGLDGVLRARSSDLYGILNGVDYGELGPANRSSSRALFGGRSQWETDMQAGFDSRVRAAGGRHERPLAGVVSRLTPQKGTELIAESRGRDWRRGPVPGDTRDGGRGLRRRSAGGGGGASGPHRRPLRIR